jgi:hypothetical protein
MPEAGASRGLLIMARRERLRIEAEATADEQVITVRLLKAEPGEEIVPERLLTDTMRTCAPIYLDDARASGAYWHELYFRGNGSNVRSVLCLPILRQAKLDFPQFRQPYIESRRVDLTSQWQFSRSVLLAGMWINPVATKGRDARRQWRR